MEQQILDLIRRTLKEAEKGIDASNIEYMKECVDIAVKMATILEMLK